MDGFFIFGDTEVCYIRGGSMLFNAVVWVINALVSAFIGLFELIRSGVVGVLDMIPATDLFVKGLNSVIDVSLVVSNLSAIFSVISAMFGVWGIWKIIKLIRG